jgi:hypothetical protein
MPRSFSCATLILVLTLLVATSSSLAATPEQIEAAIKRGVDYLWSRQNAAGHWERPDAVPGISKGTVGAQYPGYSALCVYALLAAGEKPNDPRMVKALEFLRTAPAVGYYGIGVRANVWLNLPQTEPNKQAMARDAKLLLNGVIRQGRAKGLYDYYTMGARDDRIDFSCSQYGVLGAWAAAQRGEPFPTDYWQSMEKAWREGQREDGGWPYETPKSTMALTAAGVSSLFITQEFLHANEGLEGTRGNINDPWIDKGMAYLIKGYPDFIKTKNLYGMYGIERAGVASGYKYFGNIDWFQAGADSILRFEKEGSWGTAWFADELTSETCFALLFLSRGRAPVMMNKLAYNITAPDGKSREANWNQRPRDVAYTTRFVSDALERPLNWQIINLNVATIADLHDAGILYIAGNQPLHFTEPELARLKQYLDEGGLIVGNADIGKAEFSAAFREMASKWYPAYEFKRVDPKDPSPLFNGEQFKASLWKKMPRIDVLSNGARPLMILIPSDDFSRAMQRRDATKREVFEFFANLFLFTSGNKPRYKGQTHVVRPDPQITAHVTTTIARLKYAGNWNPEPGGWSRLGAVMHNRDQMDLDPKVVELGVDSLEGITIAHLTGTNEFRFDDKQKKALGDFVRGGGLLIVDACGGAGEFDVAASRELADIFPDQATQLLPLKPDSPVLAIGDLPPIKFREFALTRLGAAAASWRLRGIQINGKLGVVYSPDDLSVGLVGMPIDGIVGYEAGVSTELVRHLIKMKVSEKP